MKDYKQIGEGITEWKPVPDAPSWDDLPVWMRRQAKETQVDPDACNCGCKETVTVEIHIGQRIDCKGCGNFIKFQNWRGSDARVYAVQSYRESEEGERPEG